MTTFTAELYNPGATSPTAVMHGCTEVNDKKPVHVFDSGNIMCWFRDGDGKRILAAGMNVLLREE